MTDSSQLAAEIRDSSSSKVVDTVLKTSEKVLARVTDGIYRQPGSALRELIANAYDADATRVIIRTDRPRFEQIQVDDDGRGMSPDVLAHVLQNIGGSSKRSQEGADLGVTSESDTGVSPGGRRLIGRIGIGLFSVSQLTQSFQITTKVRGDDHRTIATVALKQYGEAAGPGNEDDSDYEAGLVKIWREPASDIDSQGTSIVLNQIRPQTRRTLQSDAIWQAVEAGDDNPDGAPAPPKFHIGRVLLGESDELRQIGGELDAVPWSRDESPAQAFRNLVDAVWDSVGGAGGNPKLDSLFDFYLQMVWQLALAIPLPYVNGHPFEIPFGHAAYTYAVPAGRREAPARIDLEEGETLAERCGLKSHKMSGTSEFAVFIDDLQLARPLRFTDLPTTGHALRKPILFAGHCREEFEGVSTALTGGPLEFEAYLLWNPKIAPTEHQGSLIRIHGASGTLFDSTFMNYQVSEQTRKQQTSCEIFVSQGLEGALNIDRESFNFAHPHVVLLTAWLHAAMRRLASTQKGLASAIRKDNRESKEVAVRTTLDKIIMETWTRATGDEDVVPPAISFVDAQRHDKRVAAASESQDHFVLDRTSVMGEATGSKAVRERAERQMATVANILMAYGVEDLVSAVEFEAILRSIRRVLEAEEV